MAHSYGAVSFLARDGGHSPGLGVCSKAKRLWLMTRALVHPSASTAENPNKIFNPDQHSLYTLLANKQYTEERKVKQAEQMANLIN